MPPQTNRAKLTDLRRAKGVKRRVGTRRNADDSLFHSRFMASAHAPIFGSGKAILLPSNGSVPLAKGRIFFKTRVPQRLSLRQRSPARQECNFSVLARTFCRQQAASHWSDGGLPQPRWLQRPPLQTPHFEQLRRLKSLRMNQPVERALRIGREVFIKFEISLAHRHLRARALVSTQRGGEVRQSKDLRTDPGDRRQTLVPPNEASHIRPRAREDRAGNRRRSKRAAAPLGWPLDILRLEPQQIEQQVGGRISPAA